jgi:hypothetical protein
VCPLNGTGPDAAPDHRGIDPNHTERPAAREPELEVKWRRRRPDRERRHPRRYWTGPAWQLRELLASLPDDVGVQAVWRALNDVEY